VGIIKQEQMVNKQFDLEFQYQLYLKRVNLAEVQMHPIQKAETRSAFMAGCGQIIILLRDEVTELSDNDGVKVLEGMLGQVGTHFVGTNYKLS